MDHEGTACARCKGNAAFGGRVIFHAFCTESGFLNDEAVARTICHAHACLTACDGDAPATEWVMGEGGDFRPGNGSFGNRCALVRVQDARSSWTFIA